MAPNNAQKPELYRKGLEDIHGIRIFDGVHTLQILARADAITILPRHVQDLGAALLDFSGKIHRDCEELLSEEFQTLWNNWQLTNKHPLDRYKWGLLPPGEAWWATKSAHAEHEKTLRKDSKKAIQRSESVAVKVKGLGRSNERDWTQCLRQTIFHPFDRSSCIQNPSGYIFDQWSLLEDVRWTEHPHYLNGETHPRKNPKPDLTYGFPILDFSKGLPDSPKGFYKHDCALNFHIDFLQMLRQTETLRPSLQGGLSRSGRRGVGLKEPDLTCFPWAVVEIKPATAKQKDVLYCYCQAANASASANELMVSLFEKAFGEVPDDMPPIIVFTCIGPEIRLWLTYREMVDGVHPTKMICIWASSLELTWGVRATELILEHMQLWAFRILRPRISECLTLIRNKMKKKGHDSDPIDRSEMDEGISWHDVGFSDNEIDDDDEDEEADENGRRHQTEESESGGSYASDFSDERGEGNERRKSFTISYRPKHSRR